MAGNSYIKLLKINKDLSRLYNEGKIDEIEKMARRFTKKENDVLYLHPAFDDFGFDAKVTLKNDTLIDADRILGNTLEDYTLANFKLDKDQKKELNGENTTLKEIQNNRISLTEPYNPHNLLRRL